MASISSNPPRLYPTVPSLPGTPALPRIGTATDTATSGGGPALPTVGNTPLPTRGGALPIADRDGTVRRQGVMGGAVSYVGRFFGNFCCSGRSV